MPDIILGLSVSSHIIFKNIPLSPYYQVFTEEEIYAQRLKQLEPGCIINGGSES